LTTDLPAGFQPLTAKDGFIDLVGPIFVRWTEAPRRATARRDSESASVLLGAGTASLGFRVEPKHANPAGICHGGMLMTVLDMGIAVALKVAAKSDKFLPTINLTFDFVAPAPVGAWLESEVSFTHTTPRMGFAHGLLVGPDGPVVRANGIMKIPSDRDPRFAEASRKIGHLRQD
jgi:uncharacterized protein (TIGR00369 family)